MAKRKLRVSTLYQEIFTIIQSAQGMNENILWKMVRGKRRVFPIQIVRVDSVHHKIEVELTVDSPDLDETNNEIYLKLGQRESAFKALILQHSGKKVILSFPDEMVLNENRSANRHHFHASDEKFIQVKRIKNLSSSLAEKSYNLLVLDVSEKGLCVFVSENAHPLYEINKKLKLEVLGAYRLSKPIMGEIVFKMPHELKGVLGKEPGFKIGIQLDFKIPEVLLDRFLLKKNLFTLTDEQIVRDEAFRRKVQSNISNLRKKLSTRKNLKSLFDSIEKPHSDNQYLNQHIHMLCEVLAGVGTRLGWLTDNSIEKLIYVAYLHDIRFIAYPKLARIQTLKDFEKIKDTLSEAERIAFMEAPEYSVAVARQDTDAYPDALKILLQQKELPDGSGFPHGLTSTKIAPLSCLFIVCHFFVDYVLSYPDWTIADFVKTYQKRLKGQYFSKIFQIMKP